MKNQKHKFSLFAWRLLSHEVRIKIKAEPRASQRGEPKGSLDFDRNGVYLLKPSIKGKIYKKCSRVVVR
jgi:hypothetical protein